MNTQRRGWVIILKWKSANVLAATNKARRMLYFIKRLFTCQTKQIFIPLYSALMRPQLKFVFQANCAYLKKAISHLERIQRAAPRWVKGLRGLIHEERLQPLGKRRLRNDLVLTYKILYNQKARVKKIINKTASSNRENPTKQFCQQGC